MLTDWSDKLNRQLKGNGTLKGVYVLQGQEIGKIRYASPVWIRLMLTRKDGSIAESKSLLAELGIPLPENVEYIADTD